MKVQWMVPMIAVLAAAPLVAQQEPVRPRTETRIEGVPVERFMSILVNRRARLGVTVNMRASDTDSIGALVESVTPGGPAAKGGIRSGDLITRLDGQSLIERNTVRVGQDQSLPGLRLIELSSRLSPNDTVRLEYRRGRDRRTARVITVADDANDFAFTTPGASGRAWKLQTDTVTGLYRVPGMTVTPRAFERTMPLMEYNKMDPAGTARYRVFFGSPLANLELAPLNDDLGGYFGTTDGVLVISVPKDSRLGLKGGDVILNVDGRKPTGPAHLMRILQSYDQGESFKIEVMRNRHRETVAARLSEKN